MLQRRLPSLDVRRAAPSDRHCNLARRLGTMRRASEAARPLLHHVLLGPLLLGPIVPLFPPALPYRPTLSTWAILLLQLTFCTRLSQSWSPLLTS